MILRDLDIKIERNPVAHVFTSDFTECSRRIIRLGKRDSTEITSEAGQSAVVVKSRRKAGIAPYVTAFIEGKTGIRCIESPLASDLVRKQQVDDIRTSWRTSAPLVTRKGGLRDAQRGAMFAIFSHWTRSNAPATVVMPTGTGKTETLLATIAAQAPRCALVIVPTDPLRTQFFNKALTWGRLSALGVLYAGSQYPVVGMVRSGFKTNESLERFLRSCHIIVATMPILANMQNERLEIVRNHCDLIAIDEAHHLGAPSWAKITGGFQNSRILQLTATPFRQDGKHIGGDIIYSFPLSKCQSEGFFKPIDFIAVTEFYDHKADQTICDVAIAKLRKDFESGLQHALMARTSSKKRARQIFALYEKQHADLNPVMIYSGMPTVNKESAKAKLLNGSSKVVVCVDMLGEGFDFPPLKVAAIHDPHKSLPITLQFIGRFTRSGDVSIGDASVVANIADPKMQANVSSLYSQDADWDTIIRGSYENAVGHAIDFQRFINGFVFDGIEGFSLRNIRPKFSAFVYTVSGGVDLERLKTRYNDGQEYRLALNATDDMAVVVQKENRTVDWGNISELENTNYHCFCLFHDVGHHLLFIFASAGDVPDSLATTVADNAKRITDKQIHRSMNGINRLMLSNVGLRKRLIGPIRYRHYIGLDVGQGLKERITENTYTALLFGTGYENAERANIGCSLKGKIWSRNAGVLLDWSQWCSHIGAKLVDQSISVEDIFDGVLYPETITELQEDRTVVAADWSDFFFENMYERSMVLAQAIEHEIDECCVVVVDGGVQDQRTIRFALEHGDSRTLYELRLTESVPEGFIIQCLASEDCTVVVGRESLPGVDFFAKHPPMFWLDDSSVIADGCLLVRASRKQIGGVYDASAVTARDWSRTNIRVESQGESKRADSIQRAIIEEVVGQAPLLLFDDDGPGEVADVVGIFDRDNDVIVRFYHCKFANADKPGLRVGEIYELCGQAQKSVKWAGSVEKLTEHLKRREIKRVENDKASRFEVGNLQQLITFMVIAKQKRVRFEVVLVQPGISKAALTDGSERAGNVLRLLGATGAYLAETFEMDLHLIVSD